MALLSLSLLVVAAVAATPEQLHIALTGVPGQMLVQWATQSAAATSEEVSWGICPDTTAHVVQGESFVFDDSGSMTTPLRLHSAVLAGLPTTLDVRVCYAVGGTSVGASFGPNPSRPKVRWCAEGTGWHVWHRAVRCSQVWAVFADLGLDNDVALPSLLQASAAGAFDGIISPGDFAYDLQDNSGDTGNQFMNAVQPMVAAAPFMVTAGNHEADSNNDFAQYNARSVWPRMKTAHAYRDLRPANRSHSTQPRGMSHSRPPPAACLAEGGGNA